MHSTHLLVVRQPPHQLVERVVGQSRLTGGSTVHTINIEIRATASVSPEIPN